MSKIQVKIKQDKLNISAEILRALAHPKRLEILEFIDKKEVTNVNKIYNSLKLEQSITSQHLRILRNANLVKTRREGKFIFYSIDYDRIKNTVGTVKDFLKENKVNF